MNRRDLLKFITAATGTALIGGSGLLAGCATRDAQPGYTFTDTKIALLDEIAETILPRTDTPGAKDAEVGKFMSVYVNDCYTPDEQATFHQGLAEFEKNCLIEFQRDFTALTTHEREDLLNRLDQQARAQVDAGGPPHYFTMVKQLTLFGFFTSEVGGTQVQRHVAIPGRFDGCMPYKPGDRAWATR